MYVGASQNFSRFDGELNSAQSGGVKTEKPNGSDSSIQGKPRNSALIYSSAPALGPSSYTLVSRLTSRYLSHFSSDLHAVKSLRRQG
mgnify:CR=1 FL=1